MSVFYESLQQWLITAKLDQFTVNILRVKGSDIGHLVIELRLCNFHELCVKFTNKGQIKIRQIEFGYLVGEEKWLDIRSWDSDMKVFEIAHSYFPGLVVLVTYTRGWRPPPRLLRWSASRKCQLFAFKILVIMNISINGIIDHHCPGFCVANLYM